MFTKYPEIFIKVNEIMQNNHAVRIKDVKEIISQTIFETLSTLEQNKLKKKSPILIFFILFF